jgi:hypothetical protein
VVSGRKLVRNSRIEICPKTEFHEIGTRLYTPSMQDTMMTERIMGTTVLFTSAGIDPN